MIGGLKDNNSAANRPVEVLPLIVLTTAKMTIVVSELRITGRIIVKSSNEVPRPKALYRNAATM